MPYAEIFEQFPTELRLPIARLVDVSVAMSGQGLQPPGRCRTPGGHSPDGSLNLARLQSALDFRVRFGLTPPLGPAFRIAALCWGPLGGRQRLSELPDGGIYFLGK
jgi:hypothetical protein